MFVPETQEGWQEPVLAPHAECNRKLNYWKNKDSCADRSRFGAARGGGQAPLWCCPQKAYLRLVLTKKENFRSKKN